LHKVCLISLLNFVSWWQQWKGLQKWTPWSFGMAPKLLCYRSIIETVCDG